MLDIEGAGMVLVFLASHAPAFAAVMRQTGRQVKAWRAGLQKRQKAHPLNPAPKRRAEDLWCKYLYRKIRQFSYIIETMDPQPPIKQTRAPIDAY